MHISVADVEPPQPPRPPPPPYRGLSFPPQQPKALAHDPKILKNMQDMPPGSKSKSSGEIRKEDLQMHKEKKTYTN